MTSGERPVLPMIKEVRPNLMLHSTNGGVSGKVHVVTSDGILRDSFIVAEGHNGSVGLSVVSREFIRAWHLETNYVGRLAYCSRTTVTYTRYLNQRLRQHQNPILIPGCLNCAHYERKYKALGRNQGKRTTQPALNFTSY